MTVTLFDLVDYLGADVAQTHGDATLESVLASEGVMQRNKVTIPTTPDNDGNPVQDTDALLALDEALKRRVLVALSKRLLPYGILESGDGQVATRVSSADVEYKRLEAPYRRWKGAVG